MTAPTTDPGRALIGAVLHLPAEGAVRVLDLIYDDDLTDPRVRVVVVVARKVAEEGIGPDPVTVLAHARATGVVTRPDAVRNFALMLGELYGECPTPGSSTYYARATLEEAPRRRCAELAARRDAIAGDQPVRLRAVTA